MLKNSLINIPQTGRKGKFFHDRQKGYMIRFFNIKFIYIFV